MASKPCIRKGCDCVSFIKALSSDTKCICGHKEDHHDEDSDDTSDGPPLTNQSTTTVLTSTAKKLANLKSAAVEVQESYVLPRSTSSRHPKKPKLASVGEATREANKSRNAAIAQTKSSGAVSVSTP